MPRKTTPPNRKQPLGQVSRELWMLSGNECALDTCRHRLIGDDGSFIGEVAHIHGAEAGSARHDPSLSREDLAAARNLMLLCANCHTRIDHPHSRGRYPASKLKRLKKAHEDRFRRAAEAIEAQFTDYTHDTRAKHCTTLDRLDAAIRRPGLPPRDAEEQAGDVQVVNAIADGLCGLTDDARRLLAFLVSAGDVLGIAEVARRTRNGQGTIRRVVEELERLAYAYIDDEPDEGEPRSPVKLSQPEHFLGWPFFDDLRTALDGDPEEIRRVIIDLDFTLLD